MDSLIEFVEQNYGWFFGIGLVLIFGLIGFLAEQRKNNTNKVTKEKTNTNNIEEKNMVIDNNQMEEVSTNLSDDIVSDIPLQGEEVVAEETQLPEESISVEESEMPSNEENLQYAYDNYSQLPVETENEGNDLYSTDDFDELKTYPEAEVVETSIDNEPTEEDTEEITPQVVDERAIARQPDTDVEPLKEETDLDDIWKI